jgi:oxepin-CoA hydrolase/3-oxo-5,6-dehydrosuberyl-CoA semialdehyde dehydrogenase
MEADSLNYSMLGADALRARRVRPLRQGSRARDDDEGRTEVHGDPPHARPEGMLEDVHARAEKRLETSTVGDPAVEGVRMGPLAGAAGREVRKSVDAHRARRRVGVGTVDDFYVVGADRPAALFPRASLLREGPVRHVRAARPSKRSAR